MGLLGAFLNAKATQYNITTDSSTSTGQPIESLVPLKIIPVYFSNSPRRIYGLFDPGQIPINTPVCFSEKQVLTNQVLQINGVKYRVTSANPLKITNRTLAYVSYLERFRH